MSGTSNTLSPATRTAVAGWLNGFVEAGASHLCVRVTGTDDARQMAELAGLGKDLG